MSENVQSYETGGLAAEAGQEAEQDSLERTQPVSVPEEKMCNSKTVQLTMNRAMMLATGAAFLSIACAAVIAKSVCSWVFGGSKKKTTDTTKLASSTSPGQPQQVRWLELESRGSPPWPVCRLACSFQGQSGCLMCFWSCIPDNQHVLWLQLAPVLTALVVLILPLFPYRPAA